MQLQKIDKNSYPRVFRTPFLRKSLSDSERELQWQDQITVLHPGIQCYREEAAAIRLRERNWSEQRCQ